MVDIVEVGGDCFFRVRSGSIRYVKRDAFFPVVLRRGIATVPGNKKVTAFATGTSQHAFHYVVTNKTIVFSVFWFDSVMAYRTVVWGSVNIENVLSAELVVSLKLNHALPYSAFHSVSVPSLKSTNMFDVENRAVLQPGTIAKASGRMP